MASPEAIAEQSVVRSDHRAAIHVAVDGRGLRLHPCGFAFYTETAVQTLAASGMRVTLLVDGPINPRHELPNEVTVVDLGSASRWRWEQKHVGRWLRETRPNIYFAPLNRGLPRSRLPGTSCLLGLHDMIPWKFPRLFFWHPPRFWTLRNEALPLLLSARRADHILTVSEASRRDIHKIFPRKRVSVVPPVVSGPAREPSLCPRHQFVYVGGLDDRKRTDILLEAFARFRRLQSDFQLVLIGEGFAALRPQIERLGLVNAVVVTGFVSELEKQRLLHESAALVYLSLYEGFGLAIAESIVAGTPVICGRGGAQGEVGGEAVLHVDPSDLEQVVSAMHHVLEPSVRQALSRARAERVRSLLDAAGPQRLVSLCETLVMGGATA